MDIFGKSTSAGFYISDASGSQGTLNIYGSAEVSVNGTVSLLKSTAAINFIMKDVDSARISHVSGGLIDNTSLTAILTAEAFSNSGSINVDLADFYTDGGIYEKGETYAIALISATAIFPESEINILNSDSMGNVWEYAGSGWSDNIFYIYVTNIPEPATSTGIFGILAVLFGLCRRRK